MPAANTFYKKLQEDATTGDGAILTAADTAHKREHAFYIRGNGSVSAGAVQVETAIDENETGTWAPLGSAVTLAANTTAIVQITGALLAVRARVSTTVEGGTVSAVYVGN